MNKSEVLVQYRHKENNMSCFNYGEYSDWKFVSGGELEGIKEFIKQGYLYEIRELIVKQETPSLQTQRDEFKADLKKQKGMPLNVELLAMTDNITPIHKNVTDSAQTTPLACLQLAQYDLGKRGAFKNGNKMLILMLDDNADENGDGQYSISFYQSNMKMSECNNLCDIAKNIFKTEMGY